MYVSILESRFQPKPRVVDPILNFISRDDFAEISLHRQQQETIRILRCTRLGLSIYITCSDRSAPPRNRYVVAYESEDGERDIRHTILVSNQSDSVLDLLNSINKYTRNLCQQLLQKKTFPNDKAAISKMRKIGGFHRRDVRNRIRKLLVSISKNCFSEDAYRGFANAVESGVDEWLSMYAVPARVNVGENRLLLRRFEAG